LPEGSRGIYVGGGASVRLPKLIGVARMQAMMLTGLTYGAKEGQAMGLSQFLVGNGKGLAKGIELAKRIAENAPLTNFAVMHALPRIAESDPESGYLAESLMAAIAQGSPDAKARLKDFLEKRGKKVLRG
jgi:enoyl-CoA hydratase/carnithine racemase